MKEDKLSIKGFKDGSSNYWCNNKHYALLEDNSVVFICGGIEDEKELQAVKDYIKRNKKKFVARAPSIFDQEEIEYLKLDFGKYKGMSTLEIVATDKRYALWIFENCQNKEIKEQLKILLKK